MSIEFAVRDVVQHMTARILSSMARVARFGGSRILPAGLLSICLLALSHVPGAAQTTAKPETRTSLDSIELVQLSGLVLDGSGEQMATVPYANIYLQGSGRGTYTDFTGFFSIVVAVGDTVRFSAVGFEPATLIVPDTLSDQRYSIVQLLTQDTINLATAVIFPWPSREHFKLEFLAMDVTDELSLAAQANLAEDRLAEAARQAYPDANESGDYYLRQQARRSYYAGQVPPMNIFNPVAWSQFFKAWKNGDFKKKDTKSSNKK